MNNLRQIATKLPKSNLLDPMKGNNPYKTMPPLARQASTHNTTKGTSCGTEDPKNVHVIFGPEAHPPELKTSGTLVEKIQTKIKNKEECVSKLPPEPVRTVEVCVEPPPVVEKTPACVDRKPAERPAPPPHICGESARRDIFKEVVNESIFKQKPLKACQPKQMNVHPPLTPHSSAFARLEQTLSKMLTTAIVGLIAYWTWLYGNLADLGIGAASNADKSEHEQDKQDAPPAPDDQQETQESTPGEEESAVVSDE